MMYKSKLSGLCITFLCLAHYDLSKRMPFRVTASDAPTSAITAIHSAAQPPIARTSTAALIARLKAIFCWMTRLALRLVCTASANERDPVKAIL